MNPAPTSKSFFLKKMARLERQLQLARAGVRGDAAKLMLWMAELEMCRPWQLQ
jgi:hypothetical protein